jgi:hypothetical protein
MRGLSSSVIANAGWYKQAQASAPAAHRCGVLPNICQTAPETIAQLYTAAWRPQ